MVRPWVSTLCPYYVGLFTISVMFGCHEFHSTLCWPVQNFIQHYVSQYKTWVNFMLGCLNVGINFVGCLNVTVYVLWLSTLLYFVGLFENSDFFSLGCSKVTFITKLLDPNSAFQRLCRKKVYVERRIM